MGFWKTERGIGGDDWADIFGDCMKRLEGRKVTEGNGKKVREITMAEFADLVEFCTRGHLVVDVRFPEKDANRSLSQLGDKSVKTYPNRGQIYCFP